MGRLARTLAAETVMKVGVRKVRGPSAGAVRPDVIPMPEVGLVPGSSVG